MARSFDPVPPPLNGDSTAAKIIRVLNDLLGDHLTKLSEWGNRRSPVVPEEIVDWYLEAHRRYDRYCRREGIDPWLQAPGTN